MNNYIKIVFLLILTSFSPIDVLASCTDGSTFNGNPATLSAADKSACIANKMIPVHRETSGLFSIAKVSLGLYSGTYCHIAGGSLPVPDGYYLEKTYAYNSSSAPGCGSGNILGYLARYTADSEVVACLPVGAGQKAPDGRMMSKIITSSLCQGGVLAAYITTPGVGTNGLLLCKTSGTANESTMLSGIPDGYTGVTSTDFTCAYGDRMRLTATSASTDYQYLCAINYDDISSEFVATLQSSGIKCATGYSYFRVDRVTATRYACVVNGSYDHPVNYVITNKTTSQLGCGANGVAGLGYIVTKVISGTTLTGVCPESRIPTGYYKSSGSGTTCDNVYKPISGTTEIPAACMNAGMSMATYPGWYPESSTGQGNCEVGDKQFKLKRTDGSSTGHCVTWYRRDWVPLGYVISPEPACSTPPAGMYSYKIVPITPTTVNYCDTATSSYALPVGYKRGVATTPNNCPASLTQYRLDIDYPPPPEVTTMPDTFVNPEPAVSGKPADMPPLDIICPGGDC